MCQCGRLQAVGWRSGSPSSCTRMYECLVRMRHPRCRALWQIGDMPYPASALFWCSAERDTWSLCVVKIAPFTLHCPWMVLGMGCLGYSLAPLLMHSFPLKLFECLNSRLPCHCVYPSPCFWQRILVLCICLRRRSPGVSAL